MLNRDQAKGLVEDYLHVSDGSEPQVAIIDTATAEYAFGWVFFWESRLYLETGEFEHRLAGNAPLIVNRFTGAIVPTGTACPTEYYVEQYEAALSAGGA